jgi:hypothetical protein
MPKTTLGGAGRVRWSRKTVYFQPRVCLLWVKGGCGWQADGRSTPSSGNARAFWHLRFVPEGEVTTVPHPGPDGRLSRAATELVHHSEPQCDSLC